MPSETGARRWNVVVPIRAFSSGKQRLRTGGRGAEVEGIARALADRTLAVLQASEFVARVVVVTDEVAGAFGSYPRVEVLRERRPRGLNIAAAAGLRLLRARDGDAAERRWSLIMHADLPLLTAPALDEACDLAGDLGRAAQADVFIPDRDGTGTTAVAYRPRSSALTSFAPTNFGPQSALRHAQAGFVPLTLPPAHPLREDVDTWDQVSRLMHRHPDQMAGLFERAAYPGVLGARRRPASVTRVSIMTASR